MEKTVRVIQSIQRALDIINCFDDHKNSKLTLQNISSKLDLNINTVRGIVNTLLVNGYLEHDTSDNTYSLGLIFIPKANIVNNQSTEAIGNFIKPFLYEIADKYEVSPSIQIVSNNSIFTIETVTPNSTHYVLFAKTKTSLPMNATSSGKIFLAYKTDNEREYYFNNMDKTKFTPKTIVDKEVLLDELDFIIQNGYSCENEEIGRGISSIAVPILINNNKLYGTVSITGSSNILKTISMDVIEDLKKCAEMIVNKINHNY